MEEKKNEPVRKKKRNVGLPVLCILLLGLLGGYFMIHSYNEKQEDAEAEETEEAVFSAEADSILGIGITNENGSFVLERDSSESNWTNPENPEVSLDADAIQTLLGYLSNITTEEIIENPADLSAFGLEDPFATITVTTENGTDTIYVGDINSTISRCYFRVEGDSNVYTGKYALQSNFDTAYEELIAEETAEATEETAEATEETAETTEETAEAEAETVETTEDRTQDTSSAGE